MATQRRKSMHQESTRRAAGATENGEDLPRHKCFICRKSFGSVSSLRAHSRAHHPRAHKCNFCNYSAKRRYELVLHERTHTGERPYKCKFCCYVSVCQSFVNKHERTVHAEKSSKPDTCPTVKANKVDKHKDTPSPSNFQISNCASSKSFSNAAEGNSSSKQPPYGTQNDILVTSSGDSEVNKFQVGGIKSNVEELAVKESTAIQKYMDTIYKIYTCKFCTYFTNQLSNFKRHEKTHTGERPFKCKFCNYAALEKSNFIKHQQIHQRQNEKTATSVRRQNHYNCKYCSKSFYRSSSLTNHIKTHTKAEVYECKICDFSSTLKQLMVMHERTHREKTSIPGRSNKKLFQCRYCPKAYDSNSRLIIHVRSHTGEKPFPCRFCEYSASQMCYLKVHERIHTKSFVSNESCITPLQRSGTSSVKFTSVSSGPSYEQRYTYSICKICKFVAETEAEIVKHMSVEHLVSRS